MNIRENILALIFYRYSICLTAYFVTSGTMKRVCCICVVRISNTNIVNSFSVMKLFDVGIVGEPCLVPVIDAIEITGIILAIIS